MLFRAHVSWWQDFTTPFISFLSLSFSTQNPQFLPLIYLKRPLNWPKIRNGLLFQTTRFSSDTVTKQICYRHKSVYSKWLNSFRCVDMILANSKFAFIPFRFDGLRIFFCQLFKFFDFVLDDTNVMHLTPQNKF